MLIAYITVGDPSLSATERLICDLEKAGADIIEIGIPFSDPLADGPIIQASHQRALKKNTSLTDALKIVDKIRKKTSIPICFMLSYNLIVKYGEDKFYSDCEKYKINGVVVPDLSGEEGQVSRGQGQVEQIVFVSPTSSDERIKEKAEQASGFIYLISVAGITGKRKELSADLGDIVAKIRKYTNTPIAIGFGIGTPAQAAAAAQLADGIIVGSALVDLIAKKKTAAALKLVASMRKAIDGI